MVAETALTEGLPGPERAEGDFVPVLRPFDHAAPGRRPARTTRVEASPSFTIAWPKVLAGGDEARDHQVSHVVG